MSSAGLRAALVTLAGASSTRMESACGPRLPSATPNSTREPGLSASTPAGSEEACTKTSSPSSVARKPKPFSLSYHLTLPVGTVLIASFVSYADGSLRAPRPVGSSRPSVRLSARAARTQPRCDARLTRACHAASSSVSRSRRQPRSRAARAGSSSEVLGDLDHRSAADRARGQTRRARGRRARGVRPDPRVATAPQRDRAVVSRPGRAASRWSTQVTVVPAGATTAAMSASRSAERVGRLGRHRVERARDVVLQEPHARTRPGRARR